MTNQMPSRPRFSLTSDPRRVAAKSIHAGDLIECWSPAPGCEDHHASNAPYTMLNRGIAATNRFDFCGRWTTASGELLSTDHRGGDDCGPVGGWSIYLLIEASPVTDSLANADAR